MILTDTVTGAQLEIFEVRGSKIRPFNTILKMHKRKK